MRNLDVIEKRPIAPPALAARVYKAKHKRDAQVDLQLAGRAFTDERPITSPDDKSLEMLLMVRVQAPMGRVERPLLEGAVYKLMYFELLVKEAGQVYTVVQCHCQASDHKDIGPIHIHRAHPGGKRPQRETKAWEGLSHTTRVSEAFDMAKKEMDIEAGYQTQ